MAHSRYSTDAEINHGSQSADHLHRNLETIIENWDSRVRVLVLAAKTKSFNERVDSLPYFLHGLVEALSPQGEDIDTGDAAHVFRRHGEQRATFEDYTLSQVITEYAILREVIFDVFENVPLSTREQAIINRAVDLGLKESSAEFTNVRSSAARRAMIHAEAGLQHDRYILNGISDPLIAIDFDSRISFINEAAVLMLQQPKEDLINRNLWDVLVTDTATQFQSCVGAALDKRQACVVELVTDDAENIYQVRIYPSKDGASMLFLNEPHKHASNLLIAEDTAPRPLQ